MSSKHWGDEALRTRFQTLGGAQRVAEHYGEASHIEAAVLVPLVVHLHTTTVLLTRRTDHLHHHPGQISFPGGRREPTDTSSIEAALRETQEEVGLKRDDVEIIGALPELRTPSGFRINPIVGIIRPPFQLSLDAFEVAEAFEVPLALLADVNNYQRHRIRIGTTEREVYAVPYRGRFIWGATASILSTLADVLNAPTSDPKIIDKLRDRD